MAGWFPGGESDFNLYKEAAQHYSPDVPVHFLDGKIPMLCVVVGLPRTSFFL